jgi:hypothetical protein
LADLEEILGRRAALRGVAIGLKKDKLAVIALDSALAEPNNLAALQDAGVVAGDEIEGLVEGNQLQPLAKPQAYYLALWERVPGKPIALRVKGRGDVALTLDQAIDERKPLLSLFVSAAADVANRQWIGWSPNGPYDAGDPAGAEKYIGWHRNTREAARPVSFSTAEGYRDEFLRPGLMRYLLATGDLATALRSWREAPAPPVGVTLGVDSANAEDGAPAEVAGQQLIRRPPTRFLATLDGVVPAKVRWARWRLRGGPLREFTRVQASSAETLSYEADIPAADRAWQRGDQSLEFVYLLKEEDAQERVESLPLVYLPPAPVILVEEPIDWAQPRDAVVRKGRFAVNAAVVPGDNVNAADLKVSLRHQGKVVPLAEGDLTVAGNRLRLTKEINLDPGKNEIEIWAENKALLEAYRPLKLEITESPVHRVVYFEKLELPPQISLYEVVPARGRTLSVQPGVPLTVATRTIRVRGRITAEQDLVAATLTLNDEVKATPLAGFDRAPNRRAFAFDQEITLVPGKDSKLTFDARTEKKPADKRPVLILKYQPELPKLTLSGPPAGVKVREATLTGRFEPTVDDYPFEAQVRVNGEIAEAKIAGAGGERSLTAPLRLRPGTNAIEVVVANDLGNRTAYKRSVDCSLPPRIVALPEPKPIVGEQPVFDLVAEVENPGDLDLRGARIESDKLPPRDIPVKEIRAQRTKPGSEVWSVTIPDVRLAMGRNNLQLWVFNSAGPSPGRSVPVEYRGPPLPARPVVTLVGPKTRPNQDAAPFSFQFSVTPSLPVKDLAILSGDGQDAAVAKVREERQLAGGGSVYEATVTLQRGVNVFQVRATNKGGPGQSEPVTVSYKPRTKTVRFDTVEVKEPRQVLRPRTENGRPLPDGRIEFGEAVAGTVTVLGYVEWSDDKDPELTDKKVRLIRVWVNDFEQFDTELGDVDPGQEGDDPRGPRRYFKADLRLNQKSNRVVLDFPGINLEAGTRTEFTVGCVKPELGQRLHLLIVAPGHPQGDNLRREALTALQVKEEDMTGRRIKAPAFQDGWVYGPLTQSANPFAIYGELLRIKATLRSSAGRLNDVVIVFFEGDSNQVQGDMLLLTQKDKRDTAVSCVRMRNILADVNGAKLLLLDNRRLAQRAMHGPPLPRPVAAGGDHIAVFELAWMEGLAPPAAARLMALLQKSLSRAGRLAQVTTDVGIEVQAQFAGKAQPTFNGTGGDLLLGRSAGD